MGRGSRRAVQPATSSNKPMQKARITPPIKRHQRRRLKKKSSSPLGRTTHGRHRLADDATSGGSLGVGGVCILAKGALTLLVRLKRWVADPRLSF
jgi:hypothetical protein